MINFFCIFIFNLIDLIILRKYLVCFSHGRVPMKHMQILVSLLCVLTLTIVNLAGNPNFNLIFTCITILLYSLTFKLPLPYRLLLIVLYMGIGIVTEPIGLLLIRCLHDFSTFSVRYYLSSFLCEIIRFFIICLICEIWKIQWYSISFKMGILLFLIPVSSIVVTCLTIKLAGYYDTVLSNLLCLCIIFLVLLSNILTFSIFSKLAYLIASDYQKELLIQEAQSKEMYYKQIEESNKKIRMIKHNLKNRMIAITASKDQNIVYYNGLIN